MEKNKVNSFYLLCSFRRNIIKTEILNNTALLMTYINSLGKYNMNRFIISKNTKIEAQKNMNKYPYSIIVGRCNGLYSGGYIHFIEYNIAIEVKNGDFLLADLSNTYCTTDISSLNDMYTQELVIFYRESKHKVSKSNGVSKSNESNESNELNELNESNESKECVKKIKISLKKNIKNIYDNIIVKQVIVNNKTLNISFRENTLDKKVIDNIYKLNIYSPLIPILNNLWVDVGSHIGIFSLYVLSYGGSVISYEPEDMNLHILKTNLSTNFVDGNWNIINSAISIDNSLSENLYICNGKVNTCDHSLIKIKGRKSIKIVTQTFDDMINTYHPYGIKLNFESCDKIILNITQEKWEQYIFNGLKCVVFTSDHINNMSGILTHFKYFNQINYGGKKSFLIICYA